MNRDQINLLLGKYFKDEETREYVFPGFEQRLDINSAKVLYCLVREMKPKICLEFGTSWGGSGCVIISALQKNGGKFKYIGFELLDSIRQAAEFHITEKTGEKITIHGDIIQNLDKIPKELDFAFIDPDWDSDGIPEGEIGIAQWTYENVIPRVKKGGLVCIHDWSVNMELEYQGGGFPGIYNFIDKFKTGTMPLEKIFSMWDDEEFKKSNHALSFWKKL